MMHLPKARAAQWILPAAVLLALTSGCGDSGPAAAPASGAPVVPVIPTGGTNRFMSIVPPGSNGNSAGGIGTPVSGTTQMGVPIPPVTKYPNNFRDQLDLYGDLSYAKPGLQAATCAPPKSIDQHVKASDQACNYFKPAGITLDAADAVSTRTLTAANGKSVTIQRDGWGVPYVTGDDRQSAEYGLGFAAAQDRLWLFDILRHVGRGNVSSFLGPADTTYGLDAQFSSAAGYSEAELDDIVAATVQRVGDPIGPLFLADTRSFVAGMNAYISYLQGAGAQELPPEYATLGAGANVLFPPPAFTVNDIVANAVLIQSALGLGGGGEATNLQLLQTLDASIKPGITSLPKAACDLFRDLRHANIPDTPYSAEGTFATQSPASIDETCPQPLPAGTAIWDAGSFKGRTLFTHAAGLGLPTSVPSCLPGSVPVLGGMCLPAGSNRPGAPAVPGSAAVVVAGRLEALGSVQFVMPAIAAAYKVHPPLRPVADPVDGARAIASSDNPARALKTMLNHLGLPMTTSNWIAVNADQTASGHPIAVMGPQTGYDNPQLLWEAAVVSKGGTKFDLASRGISTVNLPYIVIGHGLDFGWSPTSAGSDFTDTWVSKLCNTDGTPASRDDANGDGFPDADGYVHNGKCVRLYKRIDTWTASPTVASLALGGSQTPETVKRYILRTHYGPVFGTALVNGVPYAVSTQRSTFYADADAAIPFTVLATTQPMTQAHYKELFNSMTSTFNWLYVDKKDTAYIQSGLYPQRAADINPELPNFGDGSHDWMIDRGLGDAFFAQYGGDGNNGGKGFPTRNRAVAQGDPSNGYFEWPGYLPLASHIQDTNPQKGYLASWNNSGAKGWWAADSNGTYGPTHRVKMLLNRLAAFKATGRKFDIGNMIEVMSDTAYTDLRGFDVMPEMLALMGQGALSADQQTVATLMQGWLDDGSNVWISGNGGKGLGAYRRDRDGDGVYDHRAAVVFMDAWYPHLIDNVLPQMTAVEAKGASLLTGRYDAPRAQGSAFQEGWFQHMKRVFDTALATPGHVDYRVLKCANSTVAADCRAAVLKSLDQALTDLGGVSNMANWDGSQLSNAKGRANAKVEDYDAVEHSSFSYLPVPAIPWLNRPTFQQAVEIYADRTGQN